MLKFFGIFYWFWEVIFGDGDFFWMAETVGYEGDFFVKKEIFSIQKFCW